MRIMMVSLKILPIVFGSVLILGVLLFVLLFAQGAFTPLPPILRDLTAVGGTDTVCPARNEQEAKMRATLSYLPEAASPVLNQRLAEEFPMGTNEYTLVAGLTKIGFGPIKECEKDSSIREAYYFSHNGLSDTQAKVYWRVDAHNKLMWIRGYISYSGL
jgi:hypothetical protein